MLLHNSSASKYDSVIDKTSMLCYLRGHNVRMRRVRVRVALVVGDGVDAGQNNGVLFLQYVSVVQGVFLRLL